jgi:hypothetical protein
MSHGPSVEDLVPTLSAAVDTEDADVTESAWPEWQNPDSRIWRLQALLRDWSVTIQYQLLRNT